MYRRSDLYCLHRPHRRQASSHRPSTGRKTCTLPVGAGLPAIGPSKKAHQLANAHYWCMPAGIRILRVHLSPPAPRQMPANAPFYPALAIFGHWHAICSLVRQVSLADYPRPATPFFQGSGPPRSRPSGGQHVEVGSTHQRS
ncbi:hypothetical protein D0894_25275 [Pseudomonas monteilii]|uniref:Uncharacterized protein n=1 Tax=Pseudomonas monteilii TaxID=76759 RepID=A0A399M030_9PSED|nr:hypothetical protein D0894_25275 [Pseudomonas monteilii]